MQEQVAPRAAAGPRERFTFRGNLDGTRHGWLRLTPAYSVQLVRELLEGDTVRGPVLDPFCGTGTTLLACAEAGIDAATVELNPFLVWLARAKTAQYEAAQVESARALVARMTSAVHGATGEVFTPPIHRIDRWWTPSVLGALGRAAHVLRAHADDEPRSRDLASLAFCRALIRVANVSFGHQSMSFSAAPDDTDDGAARVAAELGAGMDGLARSAAVPLAAARREVFLGDSRDVAAVVGARRFRSVVTSPPYSNRMSYIRELRPYMYWLGHLHLKSDAGELDWRAIGGTWGAATSRLGSWEPAGAPIPHPDFAKIVEGIRRQEPILSSYVHRYFEDMESHTRSIARVLEPGGTVHYVVGNSKFYDVMLPAEEIFAALFEAAGFESVRITNLRKRTSKKELFEFLVEGTLPAGASATAASSAEPAEKKRRTPRARAKA